MRRIPRTVTPDLPRQIVRRGLQRMNSFVSDAEYMEYLDNLFESAERSGSADGSVIQREVSLCHTPGAAGRPRPFPAEAGWKP